MVHQVKNRRPFLYQLSLCYLVLVLTLYIEISKTQTVPAVCSIPNIPGKVLQFNQTYSDECRTCSCWKTGSATCLTNCPDVSSSSASCPSRTIPVKTFGDRCNCTKLWCQTYRQKECLPGWNVTMKTFGGKVCYKYLQEPHTWYAAKEKCDGAFMFSASGRLYSVNLLSKFTGAGVFWTGGHFDGESGKFYWAGIPLLNMNSENTDYYQWSTKPFPKKDDCISAEAVYPRSQKSPTLNITTRPCGDKLQVICQTEAISQTLKKVAKCGSEWLGAVHLDVCYKWHSKPLSFDDAHRRCQEQGGHLAIPSDQFLQNYTRAAAPYIPKKANETIADQAYIGLSFDGDFKWSNGSLVNPLLNIETGFKANVTMLKKYCYVMLNEDLLVNQPFRYQKVSCTSLHPFVCEKKASSFSPVTILQQPRDTVIYSSASEERPSRSVGQPTGHTYSVKCVVGGDYMAVTSRVNGLPTQGFQLGDTGLVGADDFGLLTCDAWSYRPFTSVRSKPAVIRQFGVRYFVGSLRMSKSTFGELHALYNWFAGQRTIPQEVKILQGVKLNIDQALRKAYPKMFNYPGIQVLLFRDLITSGLGVDFRITTPLNFSQESGDLKDLLNVLRSALASITDQQIDSKSVQLLSTEYCYPTKIKVGDLELTFPMSSAGTIPSEQMCGTSGKPLGELKCLGNFTTGLAWHDNPRVTACDEQESAVTRLLRDLSRVPVDGSNAESVTKETANLTSNATELNSADVIYVSLITEGVSQLTNISQQVTTHILQTLNNVMDANTSVIASAQKVYNASSRLTKVLETLSGRIQVDANSSFLGILPNIALAIYHEDVNSTNKVSGIQLLSNANSYGIEENSVQPLYSTGTKRNINSTDITIKLPLSAVDPKGVLFLFNETKNSKIAFGRRVFADTTNVSTVADCASLCAGKRPGSTRWRWEVCASFNFHEASRTCELWNTYSPYEYHEPSEGWSSYVYVPEWESGQKISFILYNNWKLFQTPYEVYGNISGVKKWLTYSKIVSAKINTRSVKVYLEEPLVATFLPVRRNNFTNASTVCGYWDYDIGDFSQEGCWSNGTVDERHVCMCDHLTNFAILLDVHGTPIDEGNKLALSIISIIGLSLSIAGLLCTIITFLVFTFVSHSNSQRYVIGSKKLRKGRSQQTLFNLSLALLLSMIVFLAGIEQTTNRAGCITVAVLLHYLILVAFAWMLVEGVLQYLRFVKVLGTYMPRFMLKACLLAWGIPLLFVIIPVAVNPDLYGGKEYCWLSRDLFYYGFMIPVCAIIVVNIVFFILVVRALTCARVTHLQTNQDERKVAILHLYAGISTLLLLGITWVFGFLAINEARLVFQYIFCICNSLQGFFIFIFFSLREKHVRDAWRDLLCKTKKKATYSDKSESSNIHTHTARASEELIKGKNSENHSSGGVHDIKVANPTFSEKHL